MAGVRGGWYKFAFLPECKKKGLEFSEVKESGSPDLRQSIRSFNIMQKEVLNALKKRTTTLAAISHDIRTPLTALRLKAELLDDEQTRLSFVESINKIDKISSISRVSCGWCNVLPSVAIISCFKYN